MPDRVVLRFWCNIFNLLMFTGPDTFHSLTIHKLRDLYNMLMKPLVVPATVTLLPGELIVQLPTSTGSRVQGNITFPQLQAIAET